MRNRRFKVGDLAMWSRGLGSQPPGIILKVSEGTDQYLICFADTGVKRWCTGGLLQALTNPLQEKG